MTLSQSTHPLMCLSLETFMIRTGLPILVELVDLLNSVVIFLCQTTLLRWLTFLLGSQTVILTVLLFWIYIFLLTLVFVLLRLSFHCEMLSCCCISFHWLSIIFTTGCPLSLHCLWLFSCWLGQCLWSFRDHFLGRISLNSVSATSSEFCEWVQVGIDVYIPRWKYQVKSHSSPWFLAACAATIVHRNHFFNLYQKYQTSESKLKFRYMQTECVPETPTKMHHLRPTLWKTKLYFRGFFK